MRYNLHLRIILFCVSGFLMTYLSDYLSQDGGVFGDVNCTSLYGCGMIDKWRTWGVRHHWYFYLGLSLSALQAVSVIRIIIKHFD